MRLIDGDKLIPVFAERKEVWRGNGVLPSSESLMWLAAMDITQNAPTVDAVPLDKLCELLAEMYHCPSSGWPSSGRACHPECPDEAFEKLCGTGCENYSDAERWKAFLAKWMEEQRCG